MALYGKVHYRLLPHRSNPESENRRMATPPISMNNSTQVRVISCKFSISSD